MLLLLLQNAPQIVVLKSLDYTVFAIQNDGTGGLTQWQQCQLLCYLHCQFLAFETLLSHIQPLFPFFIGRQAPINKLYRKKFSIKSLWIKSSGPDLK